MPFYNARLHLLQAIESLLKQTFCDFTLWLLDDGSQDNPADCLQAFNDPRIRYVRFNQNHGKAYCLNWALATVDTDIHILMDADDVADPHRIETQLAVLTTHPHVALVSCQIRYLTSSNQPHPLLIDYPHGKTALHPAHMVYNATFSGLFWGSTLAFRPTMVKAVGGFGALNHHSEDSLLSVKLLRTHPLMNLDTELQSYRLHADQHSMQRRGDQLLDCARASYDFARQYVQQPLDFSLFLTINPLLDETKRPVQVPVVFSRSTLKEGVQFYLHLYRQLNTQFGPLPRAAQSLINGGLFETLWTLFKQCPPAQIPRLWWQSKQGLPIGFYLHPGWAWLSRLGHTNTKALLQ